MKLSTHAYGLFITVAGVLLLCPDTLMIRLIQAQGADAWSVVFWRGILTGIGLLFVYLLMEGPGSLRRYFTMDRWAVLAALTMAVQALAFVLSIASTSVANTLIIVATSPLFTALFAWAFLDERPPRRTWITIGLAFSGVMMIVYHDLGSGPLVGDLLALVTAIGLGITFVIVRHRKAVNMIPAMSLGKFVSGIAVLPLAAPLDMTTTGLGLMAFLGLALLPASFALLTLGPRYIPAPEVSLLMLLETVLGPLIVWLAIGETASRITIAGGIIVLVALGANAAIGVLSRGAYAVRRA